MVLADTSRGTVAKSTVINQSSTEINNSETSSLAEESSKARAEESSLLSPEMNEVMNAEPALHLHFDEITSKDAKTFRQVGCRPGHYIATYQRDKQTLARWMIRARHFRHQGDLYIRYTVSLALEGKIDSDRPILIRTCHNGEPTFNRLTSDKWRDYFGYCTTKIVRTPSQIELLVTWAGKLCPYQPLSGEMIRPTVNDVPSYLRVGYHQTETVK